MRTTDPSVNSTERNVGDTRRQGEQVRSNRGAERARRSASRRERIPRNVFFARIDRRVAALLVGRNGQLRVQTSADQPWQLYQVTGVRPGPRRGRLTLRVDGHGALTLSVYGSGEAGRLDLGHRRLRPRPAGFWRIGRYRDRRAAAELLRDQLER